MEEEDKEEETIQERKDISKIFIVTERIESVLKNSNNIQYINQDNDNLKSFISQANDLQYRSIENRFAKSKKEPYKRSIFTASLNSGIKIKSLFSGSSRIFTPATIPISQTSVKDDLFKIGILYNVPIDNWLSGTNILYLFILQQKSMSNSLELANKMVMTITDMLSIQPNLDGDNNTRLQEFGNNVVSFQPLGQDNDQALALPCLYFTYNDNYNAFNFKNILDYKGYTLQYINNIRDIMFQVFIYLETLFHTRGSHHGYLTLEHIFIELSPGIQGGYRFDRPNMRIFKPTSQLGDLTFNVESQFPKPNSIPKETTYYKIKIAPTILLQKIWLLPKDLTNLQPMNVLPERVVRLSTKKSTDVQIPTDPPVGKFTIDDINIKNGSGTIKELITHQCNDFVIFIYSLVSSFNFTDTTNTSDKKGTKLQDQIRKFLKDIIDDSFELASKKYKFSTEDDIRIYETIITKKLAAYFEVVLRKHNDSSKNISDANASNFKVFTPYKAEKDKQSMVFFDEYIQELVKSFKNTFKSIQNSPDKFIRIQKFTKTTEEEEKLQFLDFLLVANIVSLFGDFRLNKDNDEKNVIPATIALNNEIFKSMTKKDPNTNNALFVHNDDYMISLAKSEDASYQYTFKFLDDKNNKDEDYCYINNLKQDIPTQTEKISTSKGPKKPSTKTSS